MNRLVSVSLSPSRPQRYPFSLPAFANGFTLSFPRPVTVLLGENGCGKSTLIELVAARAGLVRIAADDALIGKRTALFRAASKHLDAVFSPTRPKGMHFAAADFATYLRRLDEEKEYARSELERVAEEYADRSDFAKTMATAPAERTLAEIDRMYSRDLAASSHGEAYLDFFRSRLRPDTLVLLDEPETPLSFQNQLVLLVLIEEAVKDGCQFLIATHSPVIAGFPDAFLLQFGPEGIAPIDFDSVPSFYLLRRFLSDRSVFFDEPHP
jgi:predicted ATPase